MAGALAFSGPTRRLCYVGLISTALTLLDAQVPAIRLLISSCQFLSNSALNPVEDAADLRKFLANGALQIVQDFHVRCDVGLVKKPIESLDEPGYSVKFDCRVWRKITVQNCISFSQQHKVFLLPALQGLDRLYADWPG